MQHTVNTPISKVAQVRAMEADLAALQARRDKLNEEVQPTIDMIKAVGEAADARSISRMELAIGLCPELARYIPSASAAATTGIKKRRAREVKVYTNPHTAEVVETKGGNNKTLKAWKTQYGAETVESWLAKDSAAA